MEVIIPPFEVSPPLLGPGPPYTLYQGSGLIGSFPQIFCIKIVTPPLIRQVSQVGMVIIVVNHNTTTQRKISIIQYSLDQQPQQIIIKAIQKGMEKFQNPQIRHNTESCIL